jgi:hypothetical protein
MTVKFTNNASTTVGTGINASATSLTVASASSFPSLSGADDYCYLTLQGATNTTREVVKATALSGNTFTIVRAQDNTSAASWVAGDIVELRMTAALLTDVIDAATVEGVKTNYQYTPTAGQTVFSGADNASATMIINQAALVSVYMNGVRLVQGTDYSVSSANNTVTLGIGATTADIIDIEVYGNFVGQSGAAVGITGGSITGTAITATSLSATGTATLNTLVSNNATISGGSLDGVTIGGTTRGAISGNAISGTSFASTGNMTFGDNNKAIFGAGSDLQIYSDGTTGQVTGNVNVTGTVTADGLTVTGTLGNWSIDSQGVIQTFTRNSTNYIRASDASGALRFDTGGSIGRLNIASNGDVSLYEDTGTTPKLAWSATNERLTLTGSDYQFNIQQGANQPWYTRAVSDGTFRLHLNGTGDVLTADTSGNVGIGGTQASSKLFVDNGAGTRLYIGLSNNIYADAYEHIWRSPSAAAERMRIDANGNVGIGTSSPTSGGGLTLSSSTTAQGFIDFKNTVDGDNGFIGNAKALVIGGATNQLGVRGGTSGIAFSVGSAEAMRIDASLNVGIGGTPTDKLTLLDSGNLALRVKSTGAANEAQVWTHNDAGAINGMFMYGSTHSTYGAIAAGEGAFYSNTNVNIMSDSPSGVIKFSTGVSGGAERMRIDASGNVGIGISSMVNPLHVGVTPNAASKTSGSAFDGGALRLDGNLANAGDEPAILAGSNDGLSAGIGFMRESGANWGTALKFYTHTPAITTTDELTERMRIDSSGNVGIGTSSPNMKVNISHADEDGLRFNVADGAASFIDFGDASDNDIGRISYDHADNHMALRTNNAERMRIDASGNVGIGGNGTGNGLGVYLDRGAIANFYEASDGTKTMIAGTDASNNFVKIGSLSAHPVGFVVGNGEKMRIDASGNVGINNSNPSAFDSLGGKNLVVGNGVNTSNLTLFSDDTPDGNGYGHVAFADSAVSSSTAQYAGLIQYYHGEDSMRFYTNATEKMRIDSSGNLLVGTTSATGSGASSGKQVIQFNGAAENGIYFDDTRTASGTSVAAIFGRGSAAVGRLDTTLNSVALTSLSDERVKNNIVDAPSASDDIDAIQVRSFDWKSDGSHQKYGMVAQELLEVAPEAVSAPEDPEEMMGVDYSKLVPMMLKEIQSLRARIAALES